MYKTNNINLAHSALPVSLKQQHIASVSGIGNINTYTVSGIGNINTYTVSAIGNINTYTGRVCYLH